MPCIICKKPDKETKYKCPKCNSGYCSVPCFKSHKESCPVTPTNEATSTSSSTAVVNKESSNSETKNTQFDHILENRRIRELLQYTSVDTHIGIVSQILVDPKLSGEHSQEGRRIVALKKIRELRKGGREANAAIEELVETVTQLYKSETNNQNEQ